ncbi:MAG: hypothetical protein PHP74_02870, partial [Candidatus Gracilibacteria bacterium]|nr:hypothetical protein [Candidatus Gracilibacteria bacterium]
MEIFPLFGNQLKGSPHVFDFSSKNTNIENYDTEDFNNFQSTIFTELEESGKNWGIGKYLEERSSLLRNYKQIVDEKRVFHVGLDIITEKDTSLYCPLEGTIEMIGKEEGKGNYGGYIILKHEIENCIFYSFYGHLNTNYTVE